MHTRTDYFTAAQLDLAVNLASLRGAHAAAAGLRAQGVALELAVRVLLKPWLRRPISARLEPSSHDEPRILHTGAAGR